MYNDTLDDGTVIDYGAAFDSLWKVRFKSHPFDHRLGDGWSMGEIRPSLKQQAYIYDRYGVRGYDQDFFADTSFFKLLKDVMDPQWIDRKSTRLNSSHVRISYAVFCLKKKKSNVRLL